MKKKGYKKNYYKWREWAIKSHRGYHLGESLSKEQERQNNITNTYANEILKLSKRIHLETDVFTE